MTKGFINKVFFSFLFLAFTLFVSAQDKITVKASINKNKILIGEPINLTIEATIPQKTAVQFFIDTFPHFEFLEKEKIDTSATGNFILLKQTIRITSFDSGHWVIPSFVFAKKIATDTIPVDVGFSDFDPKQDYHDIKEIIEVTPPQKTDWLLYIVGALTVIVLIVIWFLLRKKKPAKPVIQPLVDPYEEALNQLDILQKKSVAPKEFHSRLADIFRLYIFRRKEILSLQKTTDDLILQLRTINLDDQLYTQLSQALRLGDFVKFAKYIPSADDNRNSFDSIKNSIITMEKTATVSQDKKQ